MNSIQFRIQNSCLCFYLLIPLTISQYLLLSLNTSFYLSIPLTISQYLLLSLNICYYLSISQSQSPSLLLSLNISYYLWLSLYLYLSLSLNISYFLSLSISLFVTLSLILSDSLLFLSLSTTPFCFPFNSFLTLTLSISLSFSIVSSLLSYSLLLPCPTHAFSLSSSVLRRITFCQEAKTDL